MLDGNGIDQHLPGAKLDAGKPLAALLVQDFPLALMAVAEVSTYGARKYSRHGWKTVPDREIRYLDAKMRHLILGSTEECDSESGLLHAAHEAWNALAVLQMKIEEMKGSKSNAASY